MSVTAYDGQFSFRQNELATKGIDHDKKGMSAEQYEKFKESPFMKKARMQEEYTWTMTCDRDRKRKERDPAFKPSDSDFSAAKAYEYEKNVNYYKVLGVDDLASLEEIKKAYKKLSLIYHPDKTQGMSREQQDEHQAIFIELKNAYLVLGDQPTRRQYDRDRDYMDAGAEVNGIKKKPDKQSFDATVILKKMQEMQKPAGQERLVEVYCKLEKFFYGGAKTFKRSRRVIKEGYEYYADKVFRIDLPKGAAENWTCKMKGGDMNWDAQPDTYKFMLKSKEHEIVERRRGSPDLEVKKQVVLKPDAHLQPFLNMEVSTLAGRTILFWGRNPLYSQTGAANATLNISVQGEALGPAGMLRFSAKVGEGKTVRQGGKTVIVLVRAAYTKVEFYVSVDMDGTIENLKRSIAQVLEWHEDRQFKVEKIVDEKETSAFYSDKVQLGNTRKVVLESGTRLYEIPMSIRRARELLDSVLLHCDSEHFTEELRQCRKLRSTAAGEQRVRELWDPVTYLAPAFGYNARVESLRMAVNRALWVLRSEPDALVLQERYGQFGFWVQEPPKPKIPKRRRLPRPPVEQFLIRNALGPAKWFESEANLPDPGSETESEKEEDAADKPLEIPEDDLLFGLASAVASKVVKKARKAHGSFAAAVHPQMIKRNQRREEVSPVCNLELAPMFGYGETLQLFTKPQCFLHFYSNLKQSWTVKSGHLRPRPMFAIAVCCPVGAKRVGRDSWTRLRTRLIPLLKQAAFLMLGEGRNILPRPLKAEPAFAEDAYSTEDGIKVMHPGEDEGELEEDAENSAEEREIVELARQKAAATGPSSGPAASKAGASKASKPAKTRTVEKTFGDRKPRVLCLHDMAGGKDIFEVQAMRLFAACKDKVELIVVEGPHACLSGEELENMKEFFPGKSYLQYAEPHLDGRNWRCYKNVRSALSFIQGKLEELAPIDGVLGFSQGADFAAMLGAQSFAGSGEPLSFVCLMNPTAPGYAAELTDLLSGSPLPVPALIIRGEQEGYDAGLKKTLQGRSISTQGEKAPAAHVAKFFESPEVKVHSEGHRPFPLDNREAEDLCKAVVDFIIAKSPEPPVVELEEGELEDGEVEDGEDDGAGDGGGMFDFDDLAEQDEVDAVADEIRQQRRSERRRKGAVQEVWRRNGKMQAKRSEYVKALLAKEEETGIPAFPVHAESPEEEAARWKRLASRAFQSGDCFLAQTFYTRHMACLKEDDTEALGVAYSNRSACFVKVRHYAAALEDAQKAAELRPTWGRAWSRVGAASSNLSGEGVLERTRNAWFKAVEREPCAQHVEGLAAAWKSHGDKKTEMGHTHKEKGNEALRGGEWGAAVAYFTIGLSTMPPPSKKDPEEDEDALLRSILYSNRCAALSKARYWDDAVKDGQAATEYKEDYAKAYCRLGVAQLGCKMNEQAYISFAKALHHDESCKTARKGREVCLGLIPHWESPKALRRCVRFGKDRYRPLETTKVYAISDVHYDHPANEEWCSSIHATKFLDDVLIVSGNVADSFRALTRALTTLRAKFRRVFYVPGNHEMWIPHSENKKFPDSLCKLLAIMEMCDDLDVDIFPASICKDVFVVPLLSWYNVHFDMNDPFPDPKSQADKYAKWPVDANGQVWRYMLRLNQDHLNKPYHGIVITASHFLPRHNLPIWRATGAMKTCGCIELDDQIREARSTCHIYGHTHYRHNQVHEGVAYVHRPLGESSEDGQRDPLMCIFNGKNLCSELVQIH